MSAGRLEYTRRWENDDEIVPTDFCWNGRPLVVIDPEDREQVAELVGGWVDSGAHLEPGVPRMQAALRSLIAPPKPDEPTGLGAVVEDVDGVRFVRVAAAGAPWQRWETGETAFLNCYWRDVMAVRVLSEGVPNA